MGKEVKDVTCAVFIIEYRNMLGRVNETCTAKGVMELAKKLQYIAITAGLSCISVQAVMEEEK